jgi:glycosyltransferase involved in cell wall biosynthesis
VRHQEKLHSLTIVIPIGKLDDGGKNLISSLKTINRDTMSVILIYDNANLETKTAVKTFISEEENSVKAILVSDAGNPGATRNLGLANVETEWVTFWDADDLGNAAEAMKAIKGTGTEFDAIVGAYGIKHADGRISNLEISETGLEYENNLLRLAINPGLWRIILKTKIANSATFKEWRMAEDQAYLLDIKFPSLNIRFVNSSWYTYCVGNGGQLTKSKPAIKDLIRSISYFQDETDEVNPGAKFYMALLLRQIISGLKHGDVKLRYVAASTLIRIIARSDVAYIYKFFILINSFSRARNELPIKYRIGLTGGLGNQLFQYAAALNLYGSQGLSVQCGIGVPRLNHEGLPELKDLTSNHKLVWDNTKPNWVAKKIFGFGMRFSVEGATSNAPIVFKFEKFLFLLALKIYKFVSRKSIHVATGVGFDASFPSRINSGLIIGYFQTYRYAENSNIRSYLMQLKPESVSPAYSTLKREIEIAKPLVIHVRLSDYRNEERIGILNAEYYLKAISRSQIECPSTHVWLFSDEPDEALEFMPLAIRDRIRVVREQLTTSETFELMRNGNSYVIANSTFSWWAAYLSYANQPHVLIPEPWFSGQPSPIDLRPPGWGYVDRPSQTTTN